MITITDIRTMQLDALRTSTIGSQGERRRHYDKKAINELAESIRTVGVLQPLVARPSNGQFEIVAGERRYLAAKAAGLTSVPVSVRELSDDEVLEIQLVENLQREGLHELHEAESYGGLKKLGYSPDQIAGKVGKSKATIHARLKLLALGKTARKAFYEGKLSASHFLLLARIPAEETQNEALKAFLKGEYGNAEPMSYREATRHVHDTYMLRLADAGFPTADAELVPAAGACGPCPKRTGNQPELFGDVKGADVCTDPGCFKSKIEAWAVRQRELAEISGQKIIAGAEAKRIAPNGCTEKHIYLKGYTRLDDDKYIGGKVRSIASIVGKDVKPALLQDPETGKIVEVVSEGQIAAAVKKKGFKESSSGSSGSYSKQAAARQKKVKRESLFRRRLIDAIRAKAPTKLGRQDLQALAEAFIDGLGYENVEEGLRTVGMVRRERRTPRPVQRTRR